MDKEKLEQMSSSGQTSRRRTRPIEERFFEKCEPIPIAGCWIWTGSLAGRMGYGYLHRGGKTVRSPIHAHRFSWEFHNGRSVPDGMDVCHKCDTPSCVNPSHLFIGSRSDNMADCASKGRVKTTGKALMTHCARGHEFTPENTRIRSTGHRACRACIRITKEARSKAIRARGKQEKV